MSKEYDNLPDLTIIENDTIMIADPGNNIQLVSKTGVINLEGNEATIEYDEENNLLKVNKETIEIERSDQSLHYSYLSVPYGKRAFLKLPDGTSLWINSGSKIKFPDEFVGQQREIFVEGEIYADIFRDEKRPFIVTTNKLSITVLGTQFNMSAYKDEETVSVVLVHGSVQVKPESGVSTVMEPNQLYTYNNNVSTVEIIDVEEHISWKEGRLIFYNEPIEKILLRLSRYYNVTMILPKVSSGITCSGKLELKEDFDKLLNGLMEIIPISYAAKENEYRIKFR
jgi:ferric-dicitrate binding protein FerR (iron transport regulator)